MSLNVQQQPYFSQSKPALLKQIELEPFKLLLSSTCGFNFSTDREQTLYNAVIRRMAERKIASSSDYYNLLVKDHAQMDMLVELLTVNETYFFREPEQLRLITDRLIPDIMKKGKKGKIKIVSAGCSTGEEPYSIAMLLDQKYGAESQNMFQIVGVDIDRNALSSAVKGVYGKYSFRGMDKYFLDHYFVPLESGGLFQISESIKKQLYFQAANLNADAYPSSMCDPDIILYRNVSIYFHNRVQVSIFNRLADSLNKGGYLIVSSTETIHHNIGILSLIEIDDLFVYKKISPEERCSVKQISKPPKQKSRLKTSIRQLLDHSADLNPQSFNSRSFNPQLYDKSDKSNDKSNDQFKNNSRKLDSDISFDTALEHFRANQPEQAIVILKKIVKENPISLDSTAVSSSRLNAVNSSPLNKNLLNAYLLLANILIDIGQVSEAEIYCHAALKIDEFSLSAYIMLGIIAHQTGRYEEALKRLREALYINSDCWIVHYYLAETLNMLEDKRRAAIEYNCALELLEKNILSAKQEVKPCFPLSFNSQQFYTLCRHKLNILQNAG